MQLAASRKQATGVWKQQLDAQIAERAQVARSTKQLTTKMERAAAWVSTDQAMSCAAVLGMHIESTAAAPQHRFTQQALQLSHSIVLFQEFALTALSHGTVRC